MAAAAYSGETKKDIAVMALGVMGYLAHRHGDMAGLVCGDSGGTTSMPAKGGEAHLERLLRQVDSTATLDAAPSRIEDQLHHVARNVKGRNLLFVVADELAASQSMGQLLRRLRAQHEVLWLTVRDAGLAPGDPLLQPEQGLPDSYSVSGSHPLFAHLARDPAVAVAYANAVAERDAGRKAMLRQAGITEGEVDGTGGVMTALFALLERHRRAG